MILYHIQVIDDNVVSKFIPRVPKYRAVWEEETIKRICVSTSIGGAMLGFSYGMDIVTDIYCRDNIENSLKLRVYEFDTDNISSGMFLSTSDIIANNYVSDANISKECWILEETNPIKCYEINNILYTLDESVIEPKSLRDMIVSKDFDDNFNVVDYSWDRNPDILNIKYDIIKNIINNKEEL